MIYNRELKQRDDDGSENVAEKMNLRPFKLFCVFLNPFNLSSIGDFSWSWILKDFIQVPKKKEISSSYVHVLHKKSHW